MKLYHATFVRNIDSIRAKGLLQMWEGVYLTDSKESAIRWMGFRLKAMGETQIAIVEVNISKRGLQEGIDHSPLMELIFGVGKSLVSPKSIPPTKITKIETISL